MHYAHALRAPLCALATILLITAPVARAAAPKISGTPATTGTVGVYYGFKARASDADGNTLTFSIANKPRFLNFNATTGQLGGFPFAEDARTWSNIVISVSDGKTKVSLPAFSIVIRPNANKSPTISGTPPATATVGKTYSFQPTAKDPEGKTLSFSINTRPAWATFDRTTGKLTGTPKAANIGTVSNIKIVVTDGTSSATLLPAFSITVSGSGSTNTPPTISGTPAKSAVVGQAYAFTPTAKDANGDPLTFSITNKPAWAAFSTSTGKLSGTPSSAYGGTTTSNIVIAVSDGKTKTSLTAFSIAVASSGTTTGSAAVSWTPPTRNTDGSTLTNLAGYRIVYGTSASALTKTVQVSNPGISSYVIENLTAGTWYFAVKSYTSVGNESALSNVASRSVQ